MGRPARPADRGADHVPLLGLELGSPAGAAPLEGRDLLVLVPHALQGPVDDVLDGADPVDSTVAAQAPDLAVGADPDEADPDGVRAAGTRPAVADGGVDSHSDRGVAEVGTLVDVLAAVGNLLEPAGVEHGLHGLGELDAVGAEGWVVAAAGVVVDSRHSVTSGGVHPLIDSILPPGAVRYTGQGPKPPPWVRDLGVGHRGPKLVRGHLAATLDAELLRPGLEGLAAQLLGLDGVEHGLGLLGGDVDRRGDVLRVGLRLHGLEVHDLGHELVDRRAEATDLDAPLLAGAHLAGQGHQRGGRLVARDDRLVDEEGAVELVLDADEVPLLAVVAGAEVSEVPGLALSVLDVGHVFILLRGPSPH